MRAWWNGGLDAWHGTCDGRLPRRLVMPYMLIANVSDGSSTSQKFEPEIEGSILARIGLHRELSKDQLSRIPAVLRVGKKSSWKKLPEVFGWINGPYIICPALKEEINRIEPNTHNFAAIELHADKPFIGKVNHGHYYIILSPPRVDCIDIDHTAFSGGYGREGYRNSVSKITGGINFSSTRTDPCALIGRTIRGRHLWQLPEGWHGGLICSDELWSFYRSHKMKGWDIRKTCRVI